jgi:replicative DNA helicase
MAKNNSYDNYAGITMPFSQDAEQSVLGAILLDPSCFEKVLEYLKPESFYVPQNQKIFKAISSLFSRSQKIDFVTVLEELKKEDGYDEGDGRAYLTSLAELVPSISNVEEYAKIVREKYYARTLIKTSKDIIDIAQSQQESSETLIEIAEQKIYDIRQGKETAGLIHISDVIINEVNERLAKLNSDERDDYLGIPTGYAGIDKLTAGLNKSDLIILAARPGVGKTSFAFNVATNVATKAKKSVAIFSLEMSREQLVQRILSTEANIKSEKFRTGELDDDEWVRLAEASSALSKAPIYIDETMSNTINQMKAKLRRIPNLGLVVVDYLQLMGIENSQANRVQEISEITRKFKMLAKEMNVPIIMLSQLNRDLEKRSNQRPMLADLRDSGSIEQDADMVFFLYREAVSVNDEEKKTELKNDAELIVAKNRHGGQGTVQLFWDGEFTRFTSKEVRYDANS